MRKAVDNQVKQRKAVSKALRRQMVHITAKRYRLGHETSYRVLVEGDYYDVDQNVLDRLLADATPAQLELEPVHDAGFDQN
jgi:hypothetical protein